MIFPSLSRSSLAARAASAQNVMNRLRNSKSLPANPWPNAGKSQSPHSQLSSAPNPYATLSRFFSARSLRESGSALLCKETATGGRKGEKFFDNSKVRRVIGLLLIFNLPCLATVCLYARQLSIEDSRVKPLSHEDLSKLLEDGHVDHILVATDSLAVVDVRRPLGLKFMNLPQRKSIGFCYIQSPKSFIEDLVKTQAALGILPHEYVPVIYVDPMNEMGAVRFHHL